MDLSSLETSLLAIQIKQVYIQLDDTVKQAFVNYLRDEWAPLDDEFTKLTSDLLYSLEHSPNIEEDIETMTGIYSSTDINLVLQSLYDYLQDVYYD